MARLHRWLLAIAGLVCVGLGAVGAFVPGLPTTIFLIAASWLFARSCPVLEEKLLHARIFRPYRGYLRRGTPVTLRTRLVTVAVMWAAVTASGLVLWRGDALTMQFACGLAVAALIGTIAILRFRRHAVRVEAVAPRPGCPTAPRT